MRKGETQLPASGQEFSKGLLSSPLPPPSDAACQRQADLELSLRKSLMAGHHLQADASMALVHQAQALLRQHGIMPPPAPLSCVQLQQHHPTQQARPNDAGQGQSFGSGLGQLWQQPPVRKYRQAHVKQRAEEQEAQLQQSKGENSSVETPLGQAPNAATHRRIAGSVQHDAYPHGQAPQESLPAMTSCNMQPGGQTSWQVMMV